MTLPKNMVKAVYEDPGIVKYRGNPLIEALPPIMSIQKIKKGLEGKINFNPKDMFIDGRKRSHVIASLQDDFFQPLSCHIHLEEKLSIMIRQGYVGRNIADGKLNSHLQNGYERIMTGDLDAFRFEQAKSTAMSMSLIGCSGSGKSTAIKRIFDNYPQVIFHEEYNFTQLTYLIVDCPHDGTLKNLCIQFFRALDAVLFTDYERKYTRKRLSIDTLLALMSQVANAHAIGVLVIDEIQHLSKKKSGGIDKMLNFFVTMVNVIGLPVVLVGTPKARSIFEADLRSARRGAGFGSLVWEPMKAEKPKVNPSTGKIRKTEWIAFTDKLWKYQWLQKRDETLNDEIRDKWYDLSQGVLDIVIKLFVLSQLRAIVTGIERITVKLLQQVYDDELKLVHPMLAALRSKDPTRIAEFSDLIVPDIDISLLGLAKKIEEHTSSKDTDISRFAGNDQAERLYNLLVGMDCDSSLLVPLVERAIKQNSSLKVRELVPIVLEWYQGLVLNQNAKPKTIKKIKQSDWHTLDSDDLRFISSQAEEGENYCLLQKSGCIFDMDNWLKSLN